MRAEEIKTAQLLQTYLQILDHAEKCDDCKKKLEAILSCAIKAGDYKQRWVE